jgi:hypothetical protein
MTKENNMDSNEESENHTRLSDCIEFLKRIFDKHGDMDVVNCRDDDYVKIELKIETIFENGKESVYKCIDVG